jgi:hypothetical protein
MMIKVQNVIFHILQKFCSQSFNCIIPSTCLLDKPYCVPNQKVVYGVSEGETAYISCQLDSLPKADKILWYMNSTSGKACMDCLIAYGVQNPVVHELYVRCSLLSLPTAYKILWYMNSTSSTAYLACLRLTRSPLVHELHVR